MVIGIGRVLSPFKILKCFCACIALTSLYPDTAELPQTAKFFLPGWLVVGGIPGD